jgi:hypothetical protein
MAKKKVKKVEPAKADKKKRNVLQEEKERLSAENTAHIHPYIGDKKIIVRIAGDEPQTHPYTGE